MQSGRGWTRRAEHVAVDQFDGIAGSDLSVLSKHGRKMSAEDSLSVIRNRILDSIRRGSLVPELHHAVCLELRHVAL